MTAEIENVLFNSTEAGDRVDPQQLALQIKRGDQKAIVATAHEILTASWQMLTTGELYREQGPTIISEREADNTRRRAIRQLERLGHKVTLEPIKQAA